MVALFRNYSFVIIFFILSSAMGLFFIFSLADEDTSPNGMIGKKENLIIDQTEYSQGAISATQHLEATSLPESER